MKRDDMKKTAICAAAAAVIIAAAVFLAITAAERAAVTAGGQMSGDMRFSPVQGRYLKTDGGDMIVCGDAPYVMINETGDSGVFDGLKSGDLIEVTYEYALETYPAKMPVLSLTLIERGGIDDIPENVLESLSSLGWHQAK